MQQSSSVQYDEVVGPEPEQIHPYAVCETAYHQRAPETEGAWERALVGPKSLPSGRVLGKLRGVHWQSTYAPPGYGHET